MELAEIIYKIEENQLKIAEYGKFDAEILKKINYKLRLDWNYYSNRMEGGTLTREETRSVMVGNIDVKGKPIRDVMEMNGHDQVVRDILKMEKGEFRLSEKRIKEVHSAIMSEEDLDRKSEVGKWKSEPNEIIGYRDEKIAFASPHDVPDEIHKLLNRTNAALDGITSQKPNAPNPVELAADFHIDYVTIHPFYDGNGRTARIFTNLILISCGLPVIIIKDSHKKAYYQYLGDIQAYGGDRKLFQAFIGERVIESQQLVLDALEGKDIEEEEDIEKKIHQLKVELASKDQVTFPRNWERLNEVFRKGIMPLLERIEERTISLADLFNEVIPNVSVDHNSVSSNFGDDKPWRQSLPNLLDSLKEKEQYKNFHAFRYWLDFKGFKNNLDRPYFLIRIEVRFSEYSFSLMGPNRSEKKYPYKAATLQADTDKWINQWVNELIEDIRAASNLE